MLTVNGLRSRLAALISKGHGRASVCVHKTTFSSNLEADGCSILPVGDVEVEWINMIDDDGGLAVNKDGKEKLRKTAVLRGGAHETKEEGTNLHDQLAAARQRLREVAKVLEELSREAQKHDDDFERYGRDADELAAETRWHCVRKIKAVLDAVK